VSYRRRSYAPRPARWIDLKYAGRCHICGRELRAGTRAFYDPADKSVTCTDMACAETAGLTRQEWHGSPVSGRYVRVLSERRLHPGRDLIRDPGEDAADRWNETH